MKFRPSNSDVGMTFEAQFCDRCYRNPVNPESKSQCPHLLKALLEHENERWIYDVDGKPVCTAFKSRKEVYESRTRRKKANLGQLHLF